VERAGDAELAYQQEIIVRRMLPINHAQPFRFLPAVIALISWREVSSCEAAQKRNDLGALGESHFNLRAGDDSETRHADSNRAFLSAVPPGEANAVNVEAKGNRAHYIDGVSEPYN